MKQDFRRAHRVGRQIALVFASAARTGVVLAGIATLAIAAHAQYRASLRGTVTDPTGAVVPEATVTLTNTGTNQVMTATSDANGIYTFNGLPPDHFSVKAEKQGFQTTNIAGSRTHPRAAQRTEHQDAGRRHDDTGDGIGIGRATARYRHCAR